MGFPFSAPLRKTRNSLLSTVICVLTFKRNVWQTSNLPRKPNAYRLFRLLLKRSVLTGHVNFYSRLLTDVIKIPSQSHECATVICAYIIYHLGNVSNIVWSQRYCSSFQEQTPWIIQWILAFNASNNNSVLDSSFLFVFSGWRISYPLYWY